MFSRTKDLYDFLGIKPSEDYVATWSWAHLGYRVFFYAQTFFPIKPKVCLRSWKNVGVGKGHRNESILDASYVQLTHSSAPVNQCQPRGTGADIAAYRSIVASTEKANERVCKTSGNFHEIGTDLERRRNSFSRRIFSALPTRRIRI